MPPTPAQSQQTPDNSLSPLWITVGLFILGWLLWAFFHTQIVSVFLVIKSFESRLIALVLPSAAYLPVEINHLPADRAYTPIISLKLQQTQSPCPSTYRHLVYLHWHPLN